MLRYIWMLLIVTACEPAAAPDDDKPVPSAPADASAPMPPSDQPDGGSIEPPVGVGLVEVECDRQYERESIYRDDEGAITRTVHKQYHWAEIPKESVLGSLIHFCHSYNVAYDPPQPLPVPDRVPEVTESGVLPVPSGCSWSGGSVSGQLNSDLATITCLDSTETVLYREDYTTTTIVRIKRTLYLLEQP